MNKIVLLEGVVVRYVVPKNIIVGKVWQAALSGEIWA
jgi:hypothetical protein